jgi:hypothetical protein
MYLIRSDGLLTKGGPLGQNFVESLTNQHSENSFYEIIHITWNDKTMGDKWAHMVEKRNGHIFVVKNHK